MYKIIQLDHGRQAASYCDEFIADDEGSLVYASMFGPVTAIKAIVAQILTRRPNIRLVDLEKGEHEYVATHSGTPLNVLRGDMDILRVMSKNIKPGVVHKILFADNLFRPWVYGQANKCFVYGKDWRQASNMLFKIINKKSTVPLKETWDLWLWEKTTNSRQSRFSKSRQLAENFTYCEYQMLPGDSELEKWLKDDFMELREIAA